MSDEFPSPSVPDPIDLGDGRTVLFDEPTSGFYRVRVPITGGGFEIQAKPAKGEATPENATDDIIDNPPPPAPLPADQIYAQHLAAGYADAETGITLKTTEAAQSKFTQGLVLITRALAAGQLTEESSFSIWDASNTEHVLTVTDYRALMLRYGLFCQSLFNLYAP